MTTHLSLVRSIADFILNFSITSNLDADTPQDVRVFIFHYLVRTLRNEDRRRCRLIFAKVELIDQYLEAVGRIQP